MTPRCVCLTLSISVVYLGDMEIDQMIAQAEKLSLSYTDGMPDTRDIYREGCYRTCDIDGGFAFKISLRDTGTVCNRAEWDFYTMTTDDVREVLAKPRYISRNGKVIVFDCLTMNKDTGGYNTVLRNEFDSQARVAANELTRIVSSAHKVGIRDLHEGNFGRDDGTNEMLCTDYGALGHAVEYHDDGIGGREYSKHRLHHLISK